MEIFLISVLFFLPVYLAFCQILKNSHSKGQVEENEKWLPVILLVCAASLLLDCLNGSVDFDPACLYLVLALFSVYSLTSSLIPMRWIKVISVISILLQSAAAITSVICSLCFHYTLPAALYSYSHIFLCFSVAMVFLAGICLRLCDVKMVMRAGSVWSMVCLAVDALYMVVILLTGVLLPHLDSYASSIILASIVTALSVRIRKASVFVIFTRHERRIVESMKVSQVECACEGTGTDHLYNNIYERVLRYFEIHKPYLDHELTINDIVEVVYTNKLYISKAISHCTGRNFCQFVNYYRITYAVELFRSNPQLKVVELTNLCGFNSTTSFSAAFRLYMGESPGDWCRKERVRLTKK